MVILGFVHTAAQTMNTKIIRNCQNESNKRQWNFQETLSVEKGLYIVFVDYDGAYNVSDVHHILYPSDRAKAGARPRSHLSVN